MKITTKLRLHVGDWSFGVRVPPLSVVDELDGLVGDRRQRAALQRLIGDAGVREAIQRSGKGITDALADPGVQAAALGALGPDAMASQELSTDERSRAVALVLPYCDAPMGLEGDDGPVGWEQYASLDEPGYVAVLVEAARAIVAHCRGRVAVEARKN
jgi:hypothetical protein